jgi:hypothetical protein
LQHASGVVEHDRPGPDAEDHSDLGVVDLDLLDEGPHDRAAGWPVEVVEVPRDGGGEVLEVAEHQVQVVVRRSFRRRTQGSNSALSIRPSA